VQLVADIQFRQAYDTLSDYIKQENYKGWDLFDGLNSKVFILSPFYRSQILRLAWIQFFKRSPVNFRNIALVPKGYNPKGLALFALGLSLSGKLEEERSCNDW